MRKDMTESDITKAYTSRLARLVKIRVFSQFDKWRSCTDGMGFKQNASFLTYLTEHLTYRGSQFDGIWRHTLVAGTEGPEEQVEIGASGHGTIKSPEIGPGICSTTFRTCPLVRETCDFVFWGGGGGGGGAERVAGTWQVWPWEVETQEMNEERD